MKIVRSPFITKKPPVAEMIKSLGRGGSQKPGKEPAGSITKAQAEQIAKDKWKILIQLMSRWPIS